MGDTFDYDQNAEDGSSRIKIICLGDSAVGKSKYGFIPPSPHQSSITEFPYFGFEF